MAKQRMIVTDDGLLIDFELVFKAIREEKGNWLASVMGAGSGTH